VRGRLRLRHWPRASRPREGAVSEWIVECGGCGAQAVVHREPPARGYYCNTACERAFVERIRAAGQQVLVGFEG